MRERSVDISSERTFASCGRLQYQTLAHACSSANTLGCFEPVLDLATCTPRACAADDPCVQSVELLRSSAVLDHCHGGSNLHSGQSVGVDLLVRGMQLFPCEAFGRYRDGHRSSNCESRPPVSRSTSLSLTTCLPFFVSHLFLSFN